MEKGLKILVHASTWFAPVLVPIIVFFLSPDRDVRNLSLQALLFHVVIGVLIWISSLLSFVLIGIPFLIVFGLMAIIAPIKGIIRAANDEPYRYPIVGRWV